MAFNQNTLAKAKALCSPEGEKKINSMKGAGGVSATYFNESSSYINESQMMERNPEFNNNGNKQRTLSELKIPDIIKESFANQTIDVSALADPATKSFRAFDDIVEQFTKENEQQKQTIKEETLYDTQLQTNYGNGVIDYNIIRKIIEECIDRKFNSINEHSLKSIKLKEGKITLAANNGNVFSANLEYKGNLNDKKKNG
jgi:hypothetical protein